MSADIITLPVVRVEREDFEPPLERFFVGLNPRTAKRLAAHARDCRIAPEHLAALLLEKILFPEVDQ
jgi:hypothetical protein